MKKRLIEMFITLFCIFLLISAGYDILKAECQKAYEVGYMVGFSADFCNMAFNYYPDKEEKFVYVGRGSEDYSLLYYNYNITKEIIEQRGNGFWWAEKNLIIKE